MRIHTDFDSEFDVLRQYGVKVCMSEFTNQEVTSHFITREIDTVAVKGKVDGIKIFELIAAKDDCSWDSLSFRAEAPKEHPTFATRISALPNAKALQPFLGPRSPRRSRHLLLRSLFHTTPTTNSNQT